MYTYKFHKLIRPQPAFCFSNGLRLRCSTKKLGAPRWKRELWRKASSGCRRVEKLCVKFQF